MKRSNAPIANIQLMIRAPAAKVYEAFVDPAITTRFWFTKSSGKLEPGARVRWDWEMYGVSTDVEVVALEPNRRIAVTWDGNNGRTPVEWTFTPRGETETMVRVTNSGFGGDAEAQMAETLESTQGFSFALAAAKAWLEHGLNIKVIVDHAPDARVAGWTDG